MNHKFKIKQRVAALCMAAMMVLLPVPGMGVCGGSEG